MAFVRPKARILERSITVGDGPYMLAGAVDGSYNTFASFMAIGDATEVTVVEPGVAFWTGIATYSATNQITLTTVEETKGTFGSGTKEIFAAGLASRALLREDMSGVIITGGTANAYTLASFRSYDTLARLNGNTIAFTPHASNAGAATLNVDGLGNKPLRAAPGVELFPATLIAGTPYLALYNHTEGAFYLHGLFGNPAGVPIGAGMDYWGPIAPTSNFVFPVGQALSRTTYASLFSGNPWSIGTTFGSGDGSTTFNLPDKRGRFSLVADSLGGISAGRTGYERSAVGGAREVSLTIGNLPPYTPSGNIGISDPGHDHSLLGYQYGANGQNGGGYPAAVIQGSQPTGTSTTGIVAGFSGNPQGGSNFPFSILPHFITCNYIMRVL